jgi:nucleotide-binding universal stress UspA family protein
MPRSIMDVISSRRSNCRSSCEAAMIKDVMVRLDGGARDDAGLAAATQIAESFESHITGLFFNVVPNEFNGINVNQAARTPDAARRAGDAVETMLFQRLTQLQQPTYLRRFDVADVLDISETALPVVRTADTFVAVRPRSTEPDDLIEKLLFGTGRHLFLVPDDWKGFTPLDNILVAWNGSRESARALAESLPFLRRASKVGVVVVESEHHTKTDALKASDAVLHLRHHGINALKYRAVGEEDETADVLIAQCRSLGANLLVMGSYGHSQVQDLLPGSTTSRILHRSPVPLLIAH